MPTIRTRLYPLADADQHNVVPFYSLDVKSGLAGQFVKIVTGAANPQLADGWSNTSVGASVAGTFSNRYETKLKVTKTVSGDTRFNALGMTQLSTLEYDENDIPLRYNEKRAKEIGAVVSGESVPILTSSSTIAIWGQYIDQSFAPVRPGNLVCLSRSGDGLVASVDPTNATTFGTGSSSFIYTPAHVVGKWLTSLPTASNTGIANEFSAQGGYALFTFDTSA